MLPLRETTALAADRFLASDLVAGDSLGAAAGAESERDRES
jgi:hypothetical protein